jgi:hypothetical protein
MDFKTITIGNKEVAIIETHDVILHEASDANDVIGNAGAEYVILYEENFAKDFFDLSTRKLGELLQKFTNYQMQLAITGDFEKYPSESFKAFRYESNSQRKYLFVTSLEEVKTKWNQ